MDKLTVAQAGEIDFGERDRTNKELRRELRTLFDEEIDGLNNNVSLGELKIKPNSHRGVLRIGLGWSHLGEIDLQEPSSLTREGVENRLSEMLDKAAAQMLEELQGVRKRIEKEIGKLEKDLKEILEDKLLMSKINTITSIRKIMNDMNPSRGGEAESSVGSA